MSAGYHNLTAHYNAYFIAYETIKEIEKGVYDQYKWNYNKILPVFAQFDTTVSASFETQIEDCIEKASIAIQRHKGSKWEDDSYFVVGKARFYASEFADAVETFKYVNKKGKDDNTRHAALVHLIRVFVESNEINNAIAVSDFLKKEKLNKTNQFELYLNRAYIYQYRGDNERLVENLVKAEKLMPRSKDKSRIQFIIGQVYQSLGSEPESFKYYAKALRSNPSYELTFYTKLNMAQVTELAQTDDVKKVRKYFKKLLKDPKNTEYKDKIYYEMANFELKNGNLDKAIGFYKESIRTSVKNDRQKSYSYLKLGLINYDSLKNFRVAKSYYDSTIAVMPKDEDDYELIKLRSEILTDFVEQYETVHKSDSLIALSFLPEDSVRSIAKAVVVQRLEDEKERKKREKEKARAQQINTSFDRQGGDLISADINAGGSWYFYNPTVMSRGISEFKRVWGSRPLSDDWRRAAAITVDASKENTETETTVEEEASPADEEATIVKEIEALMANVPKTDEERGKLLDKVEIALYNLGNIYHFKLREDPNAIESFESHLVRFPNSEHKPEILYELYLIYQQRGAEELSANKADALKSEFPQSVYAKLIDNPNYREESQLATQELQVVYSQAYRLYKAEKSKLAKSLLDSMLIVYPENAFTDNIKLLQIKTIGMIDGIFKYQFELTNFIKNYPESDLLEHAQFLLKKSEEYQINVVNSSKAQFIKYFDQKHYLVVAYPNKAELFQNIPGEIEKHLTDSPYRYTSANLILNENFAMVLVNDIESKTKALEILDYVKTLDVQNKYKGEKIYEFVITQDNFEIFYQTKDLNAYLNFYDRMYP